MRIIKGYPPNIDAIRATFKLSGREIFAWGDVIYVPSGNTPPPHLIAHEEVHRRQQGDDVEGWWARYLVDPAFRLEQELEAHVVEYAVLRNNDANRHQRRGYLKVIAKRLASPTYGNMITAKEALKVISAGADVYMKDAA